MSAYAETYLRDAMENLGEAFDYAVGACGVDADAFLGMLVASGLADGFGRGVPRLVSGMSGTELAREAMSRVHADAAFPPAQAEYGRSPEYWCGWILAYCQWKMGRPFRDIRAYVSMEDLLNLYPALHEAGEDRAADAVGRMAARRRESTKLQRQRRECGYTQRELAERARVNLRTLQQYELGTKSIDRASARTVMALAAALGCRAEDLLEYPV